MAGIDRIDGNRVVITKKDDLEYATQPVGLLPRISLRVSAPEGFIEKESIATTVSEGITSFAGPRFTSRYFWMESHKGPRLQFKVTANEKIGYIFGLKKGKLAYVNPLYPDATDLLSVSVATSYPDTRGSWTPYVSTNIEGLLTGSEDAVKEVHDAVYEAMKKVPGYGSRVGYSRFEVTMRPASEGTIATPRIDIQISDENNLTGSVFLPNQKTILLASNGRDAVTVVGSYTLLGRILNLKRDNLKPSEGYYLAPRYSFGFMG